MRRDILRLKSLKNFIMLENLLVNSIMLRYLLSFKFIINQFVKILIYELSKKNGHIKIDNLECIILNVFTFDIFSFKV